LPMFCGTLRAVQCERARDPDPALLELRVYRCTEFYHHDIPADVRGDFLVKGNAA
jgi:hypothetical protein